MQTSPNINKLDASPLGEVIKRLSSIAINRKRLCYTLFYQEPKTLSELYSDLSWIDYQPSGDTEGFCRWLSYQRCPDLLVLGKQHFPAKEVKIHQVNKLREHTKVELNELLGANYDRTDSRVSFLNKKLQILRVVNDSLKKGSHEDFLNRFLMDGDGRLTDVEQRLSKYLTETEYEDYFNLGSPEPVRIEKLSRFAYKVAYTSKGACRRLSIKLYMRDLRQHSQQVFTEVFKKHSNILGEDDLNMNNSARSYLYYSISLNHSYGTKYKTDNIHFRRYN